MTETKSSSTALVAAAWLLVALPLAWGVFKSAQNAAKLFTSAPPAAPASAPAK